MHYPQDEAHEKYGTLLTRVGLDHVSHLHPLEISMGQKLSYELLKMFHERIEDGVTVIMITHDRGITERYPTRRLILENKRMTEVRGDGHA